MECFGMPIWTEYKKREWKDVSVKPPEEQVRRQVQKHWDGIAKPLDGLGRFERITAQIGAITGDPGLRLEKKAVVIFCADNGIVEEGISQSGQEVTLAVARSMAKKQSSVGRMAALIGAETIPVDVGIQTGQPVSGLLNRKIRGGTRNFRKEPAMTEAETIKAMKVGMELAEMCKKQGFRLLATGEMGIGNTTTSSAVAASLLHCEPELVTGRGAGLSDQGLLRKQRIIREAIQTYDLCRREPFVVLQTVGGLDIAALTGLCMGGALFRLPIVLDGVISMAAALLAERLLPGTKDYLIPSHKGREPAAELLLRELSLEPVIDGELALGEGTGAVMLFALLDLTLSVYHGETTFSQIQVEPYGRFERI